MLVAALALGLVVGVIIGALGGGGSILSVPLLVFVIGLSAQEATTGSLVIVGITAAVAAVGHARSGHTRWGTGIVLAVAGVPASLFGTRLNRLVEQDVLLLAFAAVMLVAATGMLLRSRSHHDPADSVDRAEPASGGAPPSSSGGTATTVRPAHVAQATGAAAWLRLASIGLLIGLLTGFLGVGGGFVIVPALVIVLRFPMLVAVGTSLLVISLNAAVALAARAGHGSFDWDVIVPFTAAAVIGSLLGKKASDRSPADTLTRAFAILLVLVAGYVAVRAGMGLP